MRAWQSLWGVPLGIALIVHGLGNAVLPLRGADVLGPGSWIPFMTALYVAAIVGFVAPGLGVLGFYSYSWLERLFGADIRNANEIRPEWQSRSVGDRVYATQHGYLGGLFGERPGWTVDVVDPEHALVLRLQRRMMLGIKERAERNTA